MINDSKNLINIYQRYLQVTADLVEILERNYINLEKEDNQEIKEKREQFIKHAHNMIEQFNNDLHILLRFAWELREVEQVDK